MIVAAGQSDNLQRLSGTLFISLSSMRFQTVERAMRFELTTPTLARLCSTTELRPRFTIKSGYTPGGFAGAGDEIRTHDPNLGKVVLYH
jgi:hypothetical protein